MCETVDAPIFTMMGAIAHAVITTIEQRRAHAHLLRKASSISSPSSIAARAESRAGWSDVAASVQLRVVAMPVASSST